MKADRVTLRADDALTAMTALRGSIRQVDELIANGHADVAEYRAELFAAYERISRALGLQPTIDKQEPAAS